MDLFSVAKLEFEKSAAPPSPPKTIEDLPPEVLTEILKFATLDGERTTILRCRQVNAQWKDIMDPLIEKRIISDEFPVCPAMKIEDNEGQFQVRFSTTRFPGGRNPFPFNSLLFNGTTTFNIKPARSQLPMMSLPAFTSRVGGNLTSFALHGQPLSITTLAAMLTAMPSLKRLSFSDVWDKDAINGNVIVIPPPPPLPSLSTLQFKVLFYRLPREADYNIIYVWLIVSYADTLVRLDLLDESFPPLRPSQEYTYSVAGGETRSIATTSESAFRNLKELKICSPSPDFLISSETPALQRFSIVCSNTSLLFDDVVTFMARCSSSLETLLLDNCWMLELSTMEETTRKLVDGHRPRLCPASQPVFLRLKSVTLRYPRSVMTELMHTEFLVKFPALERLQYLYFGSHRFYREFRIEEDVNIEAVEFGNENNQNAAEIVTLKERLSLNFQNLSGISNNLFLAQITLARLLTDADIDVEDPNQPAQFLQLKAEIEDMERSLATMFTECATFFNGLAALGENTKNVMAEQLLERGEYWSTCPGLRFVTVSSTEKPNGDVCVFGRPDDA